MREPIEKAEDIELLKYLQSITKIKKEDRYLIKNFHHRFISDRYVCPTCDDAIWEALKRIKLINLEALLLKPKKDAEQRVLDYKQEKWEEEIKEADSKKKKKNGKKEG